jgi:hypothetical protein
MTRAENTPKEQQSLAGQTTLQLTMMITYKDKAAPSSRGNDVTGTRSLLSLK